MSFKLDKSQIERIQRCLNKGTLTITVSTIEALKGGRVKGAWIYD